MHNYWNANGDKLKNLLHVGQFSVKNTWAKSLSLQSTWSNSKSHSQIDHMLCNSTQICFRKIAASWVQTVKTDHKLLSAELIITKKDPTDICNNRAIKQSTRKPLRRLQPIGKYTKWSVYALQDGTKSNNYRETLSRYLQYTVNIDQELAQVGNVSKLCQITKRSIQHAANETLQQTQGMNT